MNEKTLLYQISRYSRRMRRQRMYGTALTRKWMEILGVKTHYVTKDETNVIEL